MGRHMGHTFVYLQDAVQDCRAITIQLLADAQQGRQAVQVRTEARRPAGGEKKKIPQSFDTLLGVFTLCWVPSGRLLSCGDTFSRTR